MYRNKRLLELDGNKTLLSDAAKLLGISKSTASRWVKNGKLKLHEQQEPQ